LALEADFRAGTEAQFAQSLTEVTASFDLHDLGHQDLWKISEGQALLGRVHGLVLRLVRNSERGGL